MASSSTTANQQQLPVVLPSKGMARVKSVLSGDTVILLGKPTAPNRPPPEVLFTFEGLNAPRYVFCSVFASPLHFVLIASCDGSTGLSESRVESSHHVRLVLATEAGRKMSAVEENDRIPIESRIGIQIGAYFRIICFLQYVNSRLRHTKFLRMTSYSPIKYML